MFVFLVLFSLVLGNSSCWSDIKQTFRSDTRRGNPRYNSDWTAPLVYLICHILINFTPLSTSLPQLDKTWAALTIKQIRRTRFVSAEFSLSGLGRFVFLFICLYLLGAKRSCNLGPSSHVARPTTVWSATKRKLSFEGSCCSLMAFLLCLLTTKSNKLCVFQPTNQMKSVVTWLRCVFPRLKPVARFASPMLIG